MKLCKIIIGLGIVGLSSNALALVGDSGKTKTAAPAPGLKAVLQDTASLSIRLCNYYPIPVSWTITTENPTPDNPEAVTNNDVITVNSGKCQLAGLRGKTGNIPSIPTINNIKMVSQLQDGSGKQTTINISKVFQKTSYDEANKRIIVIRTLTLGGISTADNTDTYLYAFGIVGLSQYRLFNELPVGITFDNASPTLPDIAICSVKTGDEEKCNDYNNMK